jgi:hypothetical protein
MSGPPGDADFEGWLERELRRAVASEPGQSPLASQAAYGRARRPARRLAALGAGGVLAVALSAVALGGSAVAAMATGSPNPVSWGQRVVQAVHDCQEQGAGGPLGVGRCVDALSRQHGPTQSGDPGAAASPSAEPSPTPTRHIERAIAGPQMEAATSPDPTPKHPGKAKGQAGDPPGQEAKAKDASDKVPPGQAKKATPAPTPAP